MDSEDSDGDSGSELESEVEVNSDLREKVAGALGNAAAQSGDEVKVMLGRVLLVG